MALEGTDLALVSARVAVARIGAFRLGFCPEDVEGAGTVGPGEYAWREVKPEDDGEEWEVISAWSMCAEKCVASFTMTPNPVAIGHPVTFTDTTTPAGEATFWHWDFGDGSTSDEQNPTHIYTRIGTYLVRLWCASARGSCMSSPIAGPTNTVTAVMGARLAVVGGNYWHTNSTPGFSGFDGTTGNTFYQADSRRTLAAMIEWLCGKATGARVLICSTVGSTIWGTQFRAGLTAAGHTYELTGHLDTWEGFEPLDYDVICGPEGLSPFAYHGLATAQEKWDYVLSNGGHVLSETSAATTWAAYGIEHGAGFHGHVNGVVHVPTNGPAVWCYQRPFNCAAFGDPGVGGSWATNYYALVMFTLGSLKVVPGINTRGGSVSYFDCAGAQSAPHVTPDTYVLALWSA